MELATLEKIDLGVLEKICQVFFDQMGFSTKVASAPSTPGVSGISVLYSKSSNNPFAMCQCAIRGARVNVDLMMQYQQAMARLGLPNGYFITCGNPELSVRDFAAANKINLIDGLKFTELVNNLPENTRQLLTETMTNAQALKSFNQTGRFQNVASSTGRFQQAANETGRFPKNAEIGAPPSCAKCGRRMKLQVSTEGKYKSGRYWQCPDPDCGHITAII